MKTRGMVVAVLAMAIVVGIWGEMRQVPTVAAADSAAQNGPFEDWLMQQGDVVLQLDPQHRIFQHGTKSDLIPIGPLSTTEYCVGDFCHEIELQWFGGPLDQTSPGASWERWVCYAWVQGRSVNCLAYVPTPFP